MCVNAIKTCLLQLSSNLILQDIIIATTSLFSAGSPLCLLQKVQHNSMNPQRSMHSCLATLITPRDQYSHLLGHSMSPQDSIHNIAAQTLYEPLELNTQQLYCVFRVLRAQHTIQLLGHPMTMDSTHKHLLGYSVNPRTQ